MDLKEIQNLIKFVSKSGTAEVSLETDDFKINIKNTSNAEVPQVITQMPMATTQPVVPQVQPAPTTAPESTPTETENTNYVTIKSPMIGTFYRRPSPDKDNFVQVGDTISPTTVVCVVEAMKLFNEIEAEVSGRIVEILVENASPIEFDQPLFLVDPS